MTDKVLIDRSVIEQALEALETGIQYDYHGNPYSDNDAARCGAYDALRAALEQPQDHPEQHLDMVPTGWKPVPVEPTDSQIRAAQDTWWHACNSEMYWDQIYAAMLAAAPQPPVVEQPRPVDEKPQPPRQPLTDQQIHDCFQHKHRDKATERRMTTRAIERAHGIGGEA